MLLGAGVLTSARDVPCTRVFDWICQVLEVLSSCRFLLIGDDCKQQIDV